MKNNIITLGHGSGGKLTHDLIREIFMKYFNNKTLNIMGDSAICPLPGEYIAYTTDSYVIDPVFFPGGNIGKLAVCGTINDLCVSGAIPKYLSAGFILEEGFSLDDLETIARSMADEAKKSGVTIVCGDTKVVKHGNCDKIFINTSGIGIIDMDSLHISDGSQIEAGDKILLSGTLGDHSIAVLAARENITLEENILSDVSSLLPLTQAVLSNPSDICFMRDITRGGLATVLAEICHQKKIGIEIDEKDVPVRQAVRSVCELYGFDPLYLANEGKILIVAKAGSADKIVDMLKQHDLGRESRIIGSITPDHPGKALMQSSIGGKRMIDMLSGEMLPRIC